MKRSNATFVGSQDIVIKGLHYDIDFISEEEEEKLLEEINSFEWSNILQRRVQHYGYKYDYKNKTEPIEEVDSIPNCFQFLIDRLLEKNMIQMRPNQLIVNEYEPGEGIGPHVDSVLFDKEVVSVSLGSDIMMEFTNNFRATLKSNLYLKRRSVLVLKEDARYKWKHEIAKRKFDTVDNKKLERKTRISLTFRKIKQ